jgi:hypothetical protein
MASIGCLLIFKRSREAQWRLQMRKRNIERTVLTTLSLAACVALFGALAAGQAQARGGGAGGDALGAIRGISGPPLLDGAPSIQPQFNPSIPYTVPESPENPVSPGSPGSVFGPGPRTGIY